MQNILDELFLMHLVRRCKIGTNEGINNPLFTQVEVIMVARSLCNRKVPDSDGISTDILKLVVDTYLQLPQSVEKSEIVLQQ